MAEPPLDAPRRALVTGADAGIGAAIAAALARDGVDVVLHHRGDAEGADAQSRALRALGVACTTVDADFEQPEAVSRTIEVAGRIDILVSNVAVQLPSPWHAIRAEDADRQWRVNCAAPLRLIQALVPGMRDRGWGRVLMIGSVQQARPHPEMLVYAALKSAQENMVRNLAKQVARSGVTVNAVAPGVVATDRTRSALAAPEDHAAVVATIPAGFVAEPEDIAGLCAFLAGPGARYVTGQTIIVDGGMSL